MAIAAVIFFGVAATDRELRAERVGYQFSGALQIAGTGNISLFGISVPRNSPITGTFAFDTATAVNGVGATQTYDEKIVGGFRMDINNGAIQLSASDYIVAVADNNGTPASDSFSVDYNYDSNATPAITPSKILVNGTPWTGSRAYMRYVLSWGSDAFEDSMLTSDRPSVANATVVALFGSSSSPRLIAGNTPSSVGLTSGDYNHDGRIDLCDYSEWSKAFGGTVEYADGNHDGVVDGADYVLWRKTPGLASSASAVPEPSVLWLVGIAAIFYARRARS